MSLSYLVALAIGLCCLLVPVSSQNFTLFPTGGDPYGVAVDATGNIYVSVSPTQSNLPSGTLLAVKFSPTGTLLANYTSNGTVVTSVGLTVCPSGYIYIPLAFGEGIGTFTPSGQFSVLTLATQLVQIDDLACDSQGNLIVTSVDPTGISKVNASTGATIVFTAVTATDKGLIAVAVDPVNGNVYSSTYYSQVSIFNSSLSLIGSVPGFPYTYPDSPRRTMSCWAMASCTESCRDPTLKSVDCFRVVYFDHRLKTILSQGSGHRCFNNSNEFYQYKKMDPKKSGHAMNIFHM